MSHDIDLFSSSSARMCEMAHIMTRLFINMLLLH